MEAQCELLPPSSSFFFSFFFFLRATLAGETLFPRREILTDRTRATFIPAVRTLFRRVVPAPAANDDSRMASNDTEYAFRRAKSLISRIKASILGRGGILAGLTFFVFAALYVFQNEVALRVARTLSKRVRKLVGKVERGGYEVDEKDLGALEGWRWRVLLWG